MDGLQDFYIGVMTIPADATGTYGIRFEAFDAAGNKYSWLSADATSIVTTPVYLGGASVTKTGDPNKLALGDVFTCSIGNWANNTNPNTPVSCEWVTSGPRVRALSYTVTSQMTVLSKYGFNVILRLSANSQIDGAWSVYYEQEPGGLARASAIVLYTKVFQK
jgi:hypothetical protein